MQVKKTLACNGGGLTRKLKTPTRLGLKKMQKKRREKKRK